MKLPKRVLKINPHINQMKQLPFPMWKWQLFCILSLLFFFGSCENKIERIKEFSLDDNTPGLQIENIETSYSDSAIIKFKLISPLLVQFDQNPKEPYTEFPKGVIIFRYDTEMKVTSKITANYAREFSKDEKWLARNNVVVVNDKGDSLKTEELYWDRKNKKIYTDKFVTLISNQKITNGTGMESNEDLSDWTLTEITAEWYVIVD